MKEILKNLDQMSNDKYLQMYIVQKTLISSVAVNLKIHQLPHDFRKVV